jgi:hypothetical protein
MKKTPEHIDDYLRGRLYDAEVPPPAFVWAGVEHALRRKRRRRLFGWLMLAVLSAGAVWWYTASGDSTPLAGQDTPAATQLSTPTTTTATADAPDALFGPGGSRPSEAAAAVSGPATGAAPDPDAIRLSGSVSTPPARLPASGTPASPALPATPEAARRTDTRLPAIDRDAGRDQANASGREQPAAISAASDAAVLSTSLLPNRPLAAMLTSRRPVRRTPDPASTLTVPAPRPAAVKPRRKTKNCYDFSRHPNAWLLEGYAGPTFARKTLTPGSPTEAGYRDARLGTERPDWAYNAGLRAALIFNRNFVVRTGLHYEQVIEVFEDLEENITRIEIHTDPVTGEMTSDTSYYDRYRKYFNRLGWLDIPLQVGMELRAGRAGLSLHTGATINLLFWKQGLILDPLGGDAIDLEARGETVFKARTGLSMISNLQCFYHLAPRTRVFVEPYYRQVLKPVNIDSHPVSQRYSFWGVQVGFSRILE